VAFNKKFFWDRWKFLTLALACLLSPIAFASALSAMAPLKLKDNEWDEFRRNLQVVKQLGVEAISVDVWWGEVQRNGPQSFDWAYYDRLFQVIREEGLKISPILSTHACGGNVGDNVNIPLPDWVWAKRKNGALVQFVSEAGNANSDYVSYWATDTVIEDYKRFWRGFNRHYQSLVDDISEISVSMGPSGELHYPAYHGHDIDFNLAKWPHRGSFQAYGDLAKVDLQQYLRQKYSSVENLNRAWETGFQNFSQVEVPFFKNSPELSRSLNGSWLQKAQGADVFSWYHETLIKHANLVASEALAVFQKEGGALNKPLTFKIPGVHWQRRRHAELLNGLITPGEVRGESRAYSSIFESLRSLDTNSVPGFSLYTTAAASANISGPHPPFSRAQDLVKTFSDHSLQYGIPVKVENALASDLYSQSNLGVLEDNVGRLNIRGVTLLRMGDIVASPLAQESCSRMLRILLGR